MSAPTRPHVDYDRIAPTYDHRYQENERSGTGAALLQCVQELGARRVLEVGCGTGHWLAELSALGAEVYGLDLSSGMLRQAGARHGQRGLVRGRAEQLPFPPGSLDMVYCVNAIHHFDRPRDFVVEARRLLRPGGLLAVVGMDPHGRRDTWYVYDYFDGVYETDLARFPSWAAIMGWMLNQQFEQVTCRIVERIYAPKNGRAVLDDPFLKQESCSQLALLDGATYAAGLDRIRQALATAEAAGERLVFSVDTPLAMIAGRVLRTRSANAKRFAASASQMVGP